MQGQHSAARAGEKRARKSNNQTAADFAGYYRTWWGWHWTACPQLLGCSYPQLFSTKYHFLVLGLWFLVLGLFRSFHVSILSSIPESTIIILRIHTCVLGGTKWTSFTRWTRPKSSSTSVWTTLYQGSFIEPAFTLASSLLTLGLTVMMHTGNLPSPIIGMQAELNASDGRPWLYWVNLVLLRSQSGWI